VLVKAADGGVTEEDAATAVGLEAVLVGIDDDGVGLGDGGVGEAGGLGQRVGNEAEVAAVGCIDVDAEAVACAEVEDLRQGIDGADGGGAEGDDDGADIGFAELGFKGREADAATVVSGDGGVRELEDGGDALVGVVSLLGADDALAGGELAGEPEGFKVGEGSAGGEVAEEVVPAEHGGDRADGFDLHFGAGAAAVAGVVVGIEVHGQGIGSAGHGVGGLEHLSGVEGMEVGVVIGEAEGDGFEDLGDGGYIDGRGN